MGVRTVWKKEIAQAKADHLNAFLKQMGKDHLYKYELWSAKKNWCLHFRKL